MINQTQMKEFISHYKKYFRNHYDVEISQLEAIKKFQDNWNIDSEDFSAMFNDSLLSISIVFDDRGNDTNNKILKYANSNSLKVREMFNNLFDESVDLGHRLEEFKKNYLSLNDEYDINDESLVTMRTISTYLWLRYPDKYYIYVYDNVKSVAEQLQWGTKDDISLDLSSAIELYDDIRDFVLADNDLIQIYRELWNDECYEDVQAITLTSSITEYIKKHPNLVQSAKYSNNTINSKESQIITVSDNDVTYETVNKHYWWLTANPNIWSFSDLPIGKVQWYTLYNENGHKRRVFQNFLDAKKGDSVICYEGSPNQKIVALAVIDNENDSEKLSFRKTESLSSPIDYVVLKNSKELENMEYMKSPQGSFFKLDKDEYDFIMDLIRESNPLFQKNLEKDKYNRENFLDDVYVSAEDYDSMVEVLNNKKNIILQGAPGVGKTFTAKRLCYSIMGEKDDSRIEFVQFHQNYSYEDFVMGWRPEGAGFKLTEGIFYRFCKKAESDLEQRPYFFIIDEINRGNMSKIFGELLMLLERGYRGTRITLAYNGLKFSVPNNLYVIGMMNTADRSLAMIDYALRRRFAFIDMKPAFDSNGFLQYQRKLNNKNFDSIIEEVKSLNQEIASDRSLGEGFKIGHSYFCDAVECNDEWLKSIVRFDILPMLSEYWFDEPQKVDKWQTRFKKVFDD